MKGRLLGLAAMLAAAALAARAQEPAPPAEDLDQRIRVLERKLELAEEATKAASDAAPRVTVGANGFTLASAKGDYVLKLRGYAQLDGRFFFADDQRPATDAFLVRRARPLIEGTLAKFVEFRIMPDFGGGTAVLQDAYLELKLAKGARLRAGKFKPPVGLERLQSGTDLVFVERAHPTSLVPNRDVGLQLGGDLAAGRLEYQLGVFNGVVDGGSGDNDSGDDKELAGRILWKPFAEPDAPSNVDLALGIAATRSRELGSLTSQALPTYRTPGQQSFLTWRTDGTAANTVFADGERLRIAPQGWLYVGPFGAVAEWVSSKQEVRRETTLAEVTTQAWQLQLSWALTGERNSFKSVKPRKAFSPGGGGPGAWILAARISGLEVDDSAAPTFVDPARSALSARSLGVGLSWNLVGGVRWLLDYDVTTFDRGAATGDRPDEKVLFTRLQVAF